MTEEDDPGTWGDTIGGLGVLLVVVSALLLIPSVRERHLPGVALSSLGLGGGMLLAYLGYRDTLLGEMLGE